MREREAKLAVDEAFRMPELDDVLADASPGEPVETVARDVYYDTSDLRLARWGCTMRHRRGHGWTVKLPIATSGRVVVRDEVDFEGPEHSPPAAARDLVSSLTRAAPVHVVAELTTERRQRAWITEDGTRALEVTDDHVIASTPLDEDVRFRQVEVELGADADAGALDPVVDRLVSAGAGPDDGPKLHRALGGPALAPPDVVPGELGRQPRARAVVQAAIARAVVRLVTQLPVARVGADIEGVHGARVAVRRLRSDMRTFKPLLDKRWIASVQDDLKSLAAALGAIRDADVLLPRLRGTIERHEEVDADAAGRVLLLLDAERVSARGALLERLDHAATVGLLDELVRVAADPPTRPRADEPAEEVLPPLVDKRWRRLEDAAADLGPHPAVTDLHQVRILAKRTRYAAEAVAPVFGREARRFANAMTRIQDLLGELNDAAVAARWLRQAGPRLDPEGAFAAGQLAQVMASEVHAPDAWAETWHKASRKKLRAWFS